MTIRRGFRTRLAALIMMLSLVLAGLSAPRAAWAADDTGGTHYIAVASDRHNTPDAIRIAMGAMPDSVEYVCLNGDMTDFASSERPAPPPENAEPPEEPPAGAPLGGGGSRAQLPYNTSTVLSEVQQVFPKLGSGNVSIVYGSHDANATDDAGIMRNADPALIPSSTGGDLDAISQGRSGLIYTGYDGADAAYDAAYYVYGVSYYDMLTPNDAPETAGGTDYPDGGLKSAEAFKTFADEHPDVPLIVIGHAPIHALRKDNLAAKYWHEALNYAATGAVDGTEVRRDVVYLHGHNHTSEKTEYFIEPGGTMDVQGTSKSEKSTETIRYTYITAGYLRDNHTATLIAVNDGRLSFKNYKSFRVSFEANDGSDAETVGVSEGGVIGVKASPVREGYLFTGWYKDSSCREPWDLVSDTVSGDMTLYAGWVSTDSPEAAEIRNASANVTKKTISVKWNSAEGAEDYRVSYRKAGDDTWTRKWSNGLTQYTISGLTKKALYDICMNSAKESGDSYLYSSASEIKRVYLNSVSGLKLKAGKKSVKLSWKKDSRAGGFEIRYSTSKSMKNAKTVTAKAGKTSYTIKGLKKNKKYYVKVRPVAVSNGKAYIGAYSSRKAVKTK